MAEKLIYTRTIPHSLKMVPIKSSEIHSNVREKAAYLLLAFNIRTHHTHTHTHTYTLHQLFVAFQSQHRCNRTIQNTCALTALSNYCLANSKLTQQGHITYTHTHTHTHTRTCTNTHTHTHTHTTCTPSLVWPLPSNAALSSWCPANSTST